MVETKGVRKEPNKEEKSYKTERRITTRSLSKELRNRNSSKPHDMAASLMPQPFHGSTKEDVTCFIGDLNNWLALGKVNDDEGKIAAFSLLTKDAAKQWLETLDPKPTTYNALIQAAKNHFKRNESESWRDKAALWASKQLEVEPTEAFIVRMQKIGRRSNTDEEQVTQAIINGLLPKIKRVVLTHDIRTAADILKWGQVAESLEYEEKGTSELTEAIRKLEAKVESLSISPVCEQPSGYNQQYSTDPQARLIFNSYQDSSNLVNPPRFSNRPSSNSRQGRSTVFNTGSCTFCGFEMHPRERCPARNAQCANCSKMNHFARVCRNVPKRNRQFQTSNQY